jgi:methyl-accepting chemotaxis protein WspA
MESRLLPSMHIKLRLRHKVTGLALISALVPVLALLGLLHWQEDRLSALALNQFEDRVHGELGAELRGLCGMLEAANGLLQSKVDASLNVAHDVLNRSGGVTFGPQTAAWDAENQVTHETQHIELPEMKLGGIWFGQNTNPSVPTPLVDGVKQLVGGTCTIFQRMNDSGDMLRVATNIEKADGQRAIGTYIPSSSPVVQAVLGGQTYRGPAYVVNAWYISAYEPLYDSTNRVVGMLYVGVRQESDASLRDTISRAKPGENGYVWVAFGKNAYNLPPFLMHGGGEAPASLTLDSVKNASGKSMLRPLIEDAVRSPGDVVFTTGRWRAQKDPADPVYLDKEAAAIYFAPWDWVIGLTAYQLDSHTVRNQLEAEFYNLRLKVFFGALVILIFIGGAAAFFGNLIAKPVAIATGVARKIADGDLTADVVVHKGDDETTQLLAASRDMIVSLNSLLSQVKRSSIQLISTANEISSTSKLQETTVQDFGASTSQIAAAVKEISATAQELVATMSGVSDLAHNTAALADSGGRQLEGMKSTMQNLGASTGSISQKLSTISDKAHAITGVVTTITKIADQTNLLSLNAAIEAEKAGEYGLGFGVVAREIRRLADQTAVSVLDIEHMVRDMQSAVSAGVLEMDKFTGEVRGSADEVGSLGGRLTTILQQVQSLLPRFGLVKEGMSAQSQGAKQINEAMTGLTDGARRTADSLKEFDRAVGNLHAAVEGLRTEIARFKVSESRSTGLTRIIFPQKKGPK